MTQVEKPEDEKDGLVEGQEALYGPQRDESGGTIPLVDIGEGSDVMALTGDQWGLTSLASLGEKFFQWIGL